LGIAYSKRKKRLRLALFIEQDGRCYWCKQRMIVKTKRNAKWVWDHPDMCTLDHLVLRCEGGPLSKRNAVAACRWCNTHRHVSAPMKAA
jgi:hypothetical protein